MLFVVRCGLSDNGCNALAQGTAFHLVPVLSWHCGRCFRRPCVSFNVLAVDLYGPLCEESARGGLMVYAAGGGDVRTVCGYCAHGVSPEAKNYEGSTAAFTAAAGGSVAVLELLAGAGADLSAVNSYGDSPLEVATENHHDAAAAFLRLKGAKQIQGTPEKRQAASHAIVQREIEKMPHSQ